MPKAYRACALLAPPIAWFASPVGAAKSRSRRSKLCSRSSTPFPPSANSFVLRSSIPIAAKRAALWLLRTGSMMECRCRSRWPVAARVLGTGITNLAEVCGGLQANSCVPRLCADQPCRSPRSRPDCSSRLGRTACGSFRRHDTPAAAARPCRNDGSQTRTRCVVDTHANWFLARLNDR
jgi:hypothetical protein